jgi:hypothetical protein
MHDDELDDADPRLPDDASVTLIATLIARQIALENEVALKEADLALTVAKLRQVEERDLPAAMEDAGVERFTAAGGYEVILRPRYVASISSEWDNERRDRAFSWLEQNGSGSIIKRDVTVQFGRNANVYVEQLDEFLDGKDWRGKFKIKERMYVEPSTLGALVRERVESGRDVPMETLGAHILTKAKITRPKKEGV